MKNIDLYADSYNYDLDPKFIADRPIEGRSGSKLLVYNASTGSVVHTSFNEISKFLPKESMLVLNRSKVFPCRLLGQKESGGKVEVFLLSLVHDQGEYPAMIRSNGKKRIGDQFCFGELVATISARSVEGDFFVKFNKEEKELLDVLEREAQIPIPPYIRDGVADEKDIIDYQTVYAQDVGSVAAPTAGLHFTDDVFDSLDRAGIEKSFVTLHVGAGTFKPVSSNNLLEHKMHSEFYEIDSVNLKKINSNQKRVAVGTTSLRVLESAWKDGRVEFNPKEQLESTDIFLYPGKKVESIDGLITNFHLPKSTLIMLVSSLLGREKTLELYEIAKDNDYRFFSYGDAMLILR